MGFKFFPKKGRKVERNFAKVSNEKLTLSKEFWEQELKKGDVGLFFDFERCVVGLKTVEEGGYRVACQKRSQSVYIRWTAFVNCVKLHLDEPKELPLEKEGEFWVLRLR
ncbi:MAG: hypothetical protein QXQ53_01310 [Candidatus Methanosuratincola sp.]